jgi:hypothetical protein
MAQPSKNPEEHTLVAQYNFAIDGTGTGAWIKLDNNIVMPDNAIIKRIKFSVTKAFTTGAGTPTVTFTWGPASGSSGTANMFLGAIAYTAFSQDAIIEAPNHDKVSDASGWSVFVIMGAGALTGGVADIFVDYYLGYPE